MNNKQKHKIALIPLFLSLCIILLSIGYASNNSITGEIIGTLFAAKQDGVFITEVVYDSSMDANESDCSINNFYKTTLNSSIVLSDNPDSAITYKVTVYNSTDEIYKFNQVLYGNDFYDNEKIIFELVGLSKGDTIIGNGYISFYITFKYLDNIVINNNILNSYLNFEFAEFSSENIELDLKSSIYASWSNAGLYYYQVDFTLTNIGDSDASSWNINIPIESGYEYMGGWSSSSVAINYDDKYNLNVSSEYLLTRGSSITFTVQISTTDSDLKFENADIDGSADKVEEDNPSYSYNNVTSTEGIKVNLDLANKWSTGDNEHYFQYNLTVTNTTNTAIDNWQVVLTVPTGSKITQAWNIDYQNDNDVVIIKSPSDNVLATNGSYVYGGFIIILTKDNYTFTVSE